MKAIPDERKVFERTACRRLGADELCRTRHRDWRRKPPFGEHPLGFVLYTPDGYVSAQLQRPDRPRFADGDLLRATQEEYAAAGSSYIGYSGRFFVDEDKKTLSHEMAVSFFPNWLGQRQVRLVEVGNDRLQLSTDGPRRFNGALRPAQWADAGAVGERDS